MEEYIDHNGQPVGAPVTNWQICERPGGAAMHARYCCLQRLNPECHLHELHGAYSAFRGCGGGWPYRLVTTVAAHANGDRGDVPYDGTIIQ